MKFKNISEVYNSEVDGSSYQGCVIVSYEKLIELFGQPIDGFEKTQKEWVLEFEDGTYVTIYDWKEYGTPYTEVTEWHIGGFQKESVELILSVIYEN